MRLCTIRTSEGTTAARVEGDQVVKLSDYADVGALLIRLDDLGAAAHLDGDTSPLEEVDLAPLVPHPDKIVCVGLNYRDHILEMGNAVPEAPTYFAKYRGALIGARDNIVLPPTEVSTAVDWEAELGVVIGSPVRHATADEAAKAIAGYCVINDVSVRDWQRRTKQFLAGKTFESTTPVGPWLVTADEVGDGSGLAIGTEVNGVAKQLGNTDELVFNPVDLIMDLSKVITLLPGDLIATGTTGGVGAARTPPEWLVAGDDVRTWIDQVGELRNRCAQPG